MEDRNGGKMRKIFRKYYFQLWQYNRNEGKKISETKTGQISMGNKNPGIKGKINTPSSTDFPVIVRKSLFHIKRCRRLGIITALELTFYNCYK